MRLLITGVNGLLGEHLVRHYLLDPTMSVVGVGRGICRISNLPTLGNWRYEALDITDGVGITTLIETVQPDIIIHAAAMTQIDQAELDPIACWAANVTATRFILHAAGLVGAGVVFVSTDFVFDGLAGPYAETDRPSPVNYYGSSKWAAERAVQAYIGWWAIVRTVLVYGQVGDGTRAHLLTWVKESLEACQQIRVVQDQWRTPTYVGDLVAGIARVVDQRRSGLWHISGAETMTPFDMAIATAKHLRLPTVGIQPVTAATFQQPGKRPPRTGFIIDQARIQLGYEPRSFEAGLQMMFPQFP
jgi:dTDP-4-dehydrorhamnose reductase